MAQTQVQVAFTFDVDGEAPLISMGEEWMASSAVLGEARYGVRRGLVRILSLLEAEGIRSTFFVPGWIAEQYPREISRIQTGGHEIAHHGYLHKDAASLDGSEQIAELEKGLQALNNILSVRPIGYRAPNFSITDMTFRYLRDHDFLYDSSCMADDRPYVEGPDDAPILELPVHWSLDDGVFYHWYPHTGGHLPGGSSLRDTWIAEFEIAKRERRLVTYTMHPHWTGRPYGVRMLEQVMAKMRESGAVEFVTLSEYAERHGAFGSAEAE